MRDVTLIVAQLLACNFSECALAEQPWAVYHSDDYGYSLSYPADLYQPVAPASNADLVQFVSEDGQAKLTVFGALNSSNIGLLAYRKTVLREFDGYEHVEYGPVGGNWFVLSGYRNDSIYYQKVMFSCGGRVINALAMTYPASSKRAFDPIVTGIEKQFRPAYGAACPR